MYYVSSLVPSEWMVCVCCYSVPFVVLAFGFPVYTTCIPKGVYMASFLFLYLICSFIKIKKKIILVDSSLV